MNVTVNTEELEAAIEAAELTEDEATHVRQLVSGGGFVGPAIEHVLELREDEQATGDDEPTPTEQPDEPTPEQLERLGGELQRHREAVEEIMGAFVQGFETCETCAGAGLTPPDSGPPPNDHFIECPTCNGWAYVRTGSKDPENVVRRCPGCGGRGYLEELDANGNPTAADGQQPAIVIPDVEELLEQPAETGQDEPPATTRFGTPAWMGDTSAGS